MKARHLLSLVLGVLGVLVGVACGGESRTEPIAQSAFMADYSGALCEASRRCCPDSASAGRICAGELQSLGFDLEAAREGSYSYDPDAARRCLTALQATDICEAGPLPIVCREVFVGKLGPGETCDTDLECRAPAPSSLPVCEYEADGVKRCAAASELGDACEYTCDVDGFCYVAGQGTGSCYLSLGLHCSLVTGQCESLEPVGAPCSETFACESRSCSDVGCADPLPVGSSCSSRAPCARDLYCLDGTCTPLLSVGDACSEQVPCRTGCVDGRCRPDTPLCTD